MTTLTNMNTPSATGLTMTADRHYATLALLGPGAYTKLGVYLGNAATGKSVRCAIYAVGTGGLPGDLLVDGGGNLSVDSGTGEKEHTIAFTLLAPRFVYLTVQSDGTPAIAGYASAGRSPLGWSAGNVTSVQAAVFRDVTYGAPAASFGAASYTSTSFPRVWVRL